MHMGAYGNRRMLGAALAISLTAHLLLAAFVHAPAQAVPYQIPRVITHIWIRPPKPKPTPFVQPHTLHNVVAHTVVPRLPTRTHEARKPNGAGPIAPYSSTGEPPAPGNTGNGDYGASGPPGPPGGAVPAIPPGPACSDPNQEARTIVAVSPDAPAGDAPASNVTAMIKVDLDENGNVTGVSVYASTGSLTLDQAAMQAARASTYSPETRGCRPVSGSYLFKVEFSS